MLPVVGQAGIQLCGGRSPRGGNRAVSSSLPGDGKQRHRRSLRHAYELESLAEERAKTSELNSLLEMLPKTGSGA